MLYEISSGNGPAECEAAVSRFADYLVRNYNAKIISFSVGYNKGTYRSAVIECDNNLSEFIGSVLWVCKSPYRPEHKRKNWFIDFKQTSPCSNIVFDAKKVVFSTFHSGGNGGQHVNKVETGIRAVYLPTGDSVVCTDERSQYANKKKAVLRLEAIIKSKNLKDKTTNANSIRVSHVNLERGKASAKFVGKDFRRV